MKKAWFKVLSLATLALVGCVETAQATKLETTAVQTTVDTVVDTTNLFTDRDLDGTYDEAMSQKIDLSSVTGSVVDITQAGTYIVSGQSEGVQIKVSVSDTDKVQLVLEGVTMTNDAPVIYVDSGDKVFVTLANQTVNTLSDTATRVDESLDAVIFSRSDVTFNGTGKLVINGRYKNAIESNDDLKIASGTYDITAVNHGLNVNDALVIGYATVTIDAGKDGLHAENDDDTTLGNIVIRDGQVTISASEDGVDAGNEFMMMSGNLSIVTSYEGIEAKVIRQLDGDIAVVSQDDGLNASSGTTTTQNTQNMQMPQNMQLSPNQMSNQMSPTNQGGMTAQMGPGGQMGSGMEVSNPALQIIIDGGTLVVDSEGDGIDSNGTVTINGGTVVINGSVRGGNGALDANGEVTVNGGQLIALGTADMLQTPSASSTQASLVATLSGQKGSVIRVRNSQNHIILEYTATKAFQSVVLSHDELVANDTYTLEVDGTSQKVTATMGSTMHQIR